MRREQGLHAGDERKAHGIMAAEHGWLVWGFAAILVVASAVTAWGQFGHPAGIRSPAPQRGWVGRAEQPVVQPPAVAPSEAESHPVEEVLAPAEDTPQNETVEQTDESLSEVTPDAIGQTPEETVNDSAEEKNKNPSEDAGAAEVEAGMATDGQEEVKSALPEESGAEEAPETMDAEMQEEERLDDAQSTEVEPEVVPENETVGKEEPSDEAEPEVAKPQEEVKLSPCLACILGEDEEICDEEGCPNHGQRHCDYQP